MSMNRTPASADARVIVDLALDAATEAYEEGNEETRAALVHVIGAMLHIEATPAQELLIAGIR